MHNIVIMTKGLQLLEEPVQVHSLVQGLRRCVCVRARVCVHYAYIGR